MARADPPHLKAVADPTTLDLAFKALANETRRGILGVLHDWGGYLSSHDIARRFDVTWQGISRHLRVLTEAGLVVCDVRRNERAYALNRDQLRRVPGRWVARVATAGTRDGGRQARPSTSPAWPNSRGSTPPFSGHSAAFFERPPQEGLDLGDVHAAAHGRQHRQQDAAV